MCIKTKMLKTNLYIIKNYENKKNHRINILKFNCSERITGGQDIKYRRSTVSVEKPS